MVVSALATFLFKGLEHLPHTDAPPRKKRREPAARTPTLLGLADVFLVQVDPSLLQKGLQIAMGHALSPRLKWTFSVHIVCVPHFGRYACLPSFGP